MAYKPEQGRIARLAAYWSLALLILYGCTSLHAELSSRFGGVLGKPLIASFQKIPVLGFKLNAAFLITTVVLGASLFFLYRWQQKPKVADLLIDTESELRKVTWPTFPEAVNSSIIVIVCVLFLMGFLAGADWALGRWTTFLFSGGLG
jgi:preprotein translocase SecE subunit